MLSNDRRLLGRTAYLNQTCRQKDREMDSACVNCMNEEVYRAKKRGCFQVITVKTTKKKCSVTPLVSNKGDHHLSGQGDDLLRMWLRDNAVAERV